METTKEETRACPYCKEEIKAEAIKCKHCHSSIAPEKPDHGGTCPYCKEEIKAEAIKCKHCQSSLLGQNQADYSYGGVESCPGTHTMRAMLQPGIGVSSGSWCWAVCYGFCRLGGGPHYECNLGCDLACGTGTVVANNPFNKLKGYIL